MFKHLHAYKFRSNNKKIRRAWTRKQGLGGCLRGGVGSQQPGQMEDAAEGARQASVGGRVERRGGVQGTGQQRGSRCSVSGLIGNQNDISGNLELRWGQVPTPDCRIGAVGAPWPREGLFLSWPWVESLAQSAQQVYRTRSNFYLGPS